MAGLIDASIIKPELANSFATGYQKAGEARQTSELKQFQLDELKRDRDSMLQLQSQLKAAGQDPDLNKVFDVMYRSGKPDLMMKAIEGKQRLNQIQQAETMLTGLFGGPAPAVNAMAPAAASGMPFASAPEASPGTPVPPRVMPQGNALTPAGSGIPENRMWNAAPMDAGQTAQFQQRAAAGDPEAQALLQTYQQRPANAMAPAAAPANAMAEDPRDINTWSTGKLMTLIAKSGSNPYLKGVADLATNVLKQRSETKAVAPGGTLVRGNQVIYQSPESTATDIKLYEKAVSQGYKGDFDTWYNTAKKSGAANVNVGPEQKSLAGPIADIAKASHDKAQSAPSMMITANSVREALNSGNVIAGVLADPRRKLAQIMELAGAGDKEKLVNTRIAIQGLAGLTLESRTELKGQGQVTENEQKLLERARSASVDELTIPELQQVVNISQRLATRMRSNHDVLLGRMAKDPNAQSTIDYYRPTEQMPEPVLEARQDTKKDAQQQKQLEGIFGKKPGE